MVLEAVAVLEQKQPVLVDCRRLDGAPARRFARGKGDEQRIVEQQGRINLTAVERKGEKNTVQLTPVKRLAGCRARLFAQVELELGPLAAEPRKHCWEKKRSDRRNDAHPQLAMQWLTLGACHFSKLFGLAQDPNSLVGNAFAERREPHEAASALNQIDPKQGF